MKNYFQVKRFIDYISSRRFAVIIMSVLLGVILLSNLLPKPYIMSLSELEELERSRPLLHGIALRLNIAEVTKSPAFIAATLFLFSSISVCTWRRIRGFVKRKGKTSGVDVRKLPAGHGIEHGGLAMAEEGLTALLRRQRWRIRKERADEALTMTAEKGRGGFWGSVLFHCGMLVVLSGALVSAKTGYNGKITLAEDYGVSPADLLRGLDVEERRSFPVKAMRLDSFRPLYEGAFPVDYRARISYADLDENLRIFDIGVNNPLVEGGYQFMLNRRGFAPRVVFRGKDGKVISDDIYVLVVFNPEDVDSFELLKGLYVVKTSFYPDHYMDEKTGRDGTRSRLPKNPVFKMEVSRDGEVVAAGLLRPRERLHFGRYSLEVQDLRYWVDLLISRDYGMPFILYGFILIVSGLAVRLLLNEKRIWFIITNKEIVMGGRSSYFPDLFGEELKRMEENMRKICGPAGPERGRK